MENMSTTSEIAKNVLAIADAIRATAYSIDPWGTDPNINASLLHAAAARLDELERENARLREALRALVQSCTTGIEANGRHYGSRSPRPMVVNAARAALAQEKK